jgi:hypothetical protein
MIEEYEKVMGFEPVVDWTSLAKAANVAFAEITGAPTP